MIIITGGAGFIGSALVWGLNQRGEGDILIVDEINHEEKEHNLAELRYEQLVSINEFRVKLREGLYDNQQVEAIVHLGACSDTTENNWEYLEDNNVAYSQEVIRWAFDRDIRCLYASSGAVYGDGANGYSDNHDLFDQLKPLNLYGKSKLMVDIWARDGGYLERVVGLRYFNIFGPNEQHKAHMKSVVAKKFKEIKDKGVMTLFKSAHPDFADGEFKRDFLYVPEAVAVTMFLLGQPEPAGVYNIGSGQASSWNELAAAMFAALDRPKKIDYIAMPETIRSQYQYFTQADISKLRQSGFGQSFQSLQKSINDYIQHYLLPHRHLAPRS